MEFRSCEQAVKFAYRISDRVEYARSDPGAVRGLSVSGLSPLDLHAQAAMIQSRIERLGPTDRCSLIAMHGLGRARTDAIRQLSTYIYPSVREAIPGQSEVALIVCHWATKRPSIRRMAEDRGVSYRKVCAWRSAVLRAWVPHYVRAIDRLQASLEEGGVVFT